MLIILKLVKKSLLKAEALLLKGVCPVQMLTPLEIFFFFLEMKLLIPLDVNLMT